MDVIESGILGGQEDWQKIAEMIRSIARRELGETSGKVSTAGRREHVDGKRGGETRKSRKS